MAAAAIAIFLLACNSIANIAKISSKTKQRVCVYGICFFHFRGQLKYSHIVQHDVEFLTINVPVGEELGHGVAHGVVHVQLLLHLLQAELAAAQEGREAHVVHVLGQVGLRLQPLADQLDVALNVCGILWLAELLADAHALVGCGV